MKKIPDEPDDVQRQRTQQRYNNKHL
jgi:hypothetical protein